MKKLRHAKILDIIAQKEIETQDELVAALNAAGFPVTQATVSRDIKDLRLTKIPDARGGYKYTSIEHADFGVTPKMRQMFADAVLSIASANNLIVVKTINGSANTIGVVIDAMKHPAILGSVAGDDTILIVAASSAQVPDVTEQLQAMLK
ncbi:MAG: arginine repressor [Clostridia bacterium]|nr:arginine repressor [Clostridia bacterium]